VLDISGAALISMSHTATILTAPVASTRFVMSEAPEEIFVVVVNHEEQYSIWPEYKAIPAGWTVVGEAGPKQACLDYINETWIDMRPLSLRRQTQA
jgi:MbtH protein